MRNRLPRALFWLGCLISLGLLGLVVVAPVLVSLIESGLPRWIKLFAEDAALRRIAVLSSIGLFITSCVFFRATTPEE